MSYLLDTNACIRYLNSSNNPVFHRLNLLPPDDVFLCDIVKFELYYGAYKSSNRDKNLVTLKIFLVSNNVSDFEFFNDLRVENWFVSNHGG